MSTRVGQEKAGSNSSMTLSDAREEHSYYQWLAGNFPLLSGSIFEEQYAERYLSMLRSMQVQAIPDDESRIVIRVDSGSQLYKDLLDELEQQFEALCMQARSRETVGTEAREFLSCLVLGRGAPAIEYEQEKLLTKAAELVRELMREPDFQSDLHACVSGVLAYSYNSRPETRLLMLEALKEYLSLPLNSRPSRKNLSCLLFDSLKLELQRPLSQQSEQFQTELLELLKQFPHPELECLLTVIGENHESEELRGKTSRYLQTMKESLLKQWDDTLPDQVSSLSFRAESLSQLHSLELQDKEKVQTIFNACKGHSIAVLEDPLLPALQELISKSDPDLSGLAAAIALVKIYEIEPACELAGAAIDFLCDWAVNSQSGRFVLDALNASKEFEAKSASAAKKVEVAMLAANQKFIFRNVQNLKNG